MGAIILLIVVVIAVATTIPAVVLYALVSGLARTTGAPEGLGMIVQSTSGPTGSPTSYYVNLSLSPTPGLSPSQFGLHLVNESVEVVSLTAASDSCTAGVVADAGNCTATTAGWYAVLVGPSGTVLATFSVVGSAQGWTNVYDDSYSGALAVGDSLMVISERSLTGGSFVLSAYGSGDVSVSGSVLL